MKTSNKGMDHNGETGGLSRGVRRAERLLLKEGRGGGREENIRWQEGVRTDGRMKGHGGYCMRDEQEENVRVFPREKGHGGEGEGWVMGRRAWRLVLEERVAMDVG